MPGVRFAYQQGGKTVAANRITGLLPISANGASTATASGQIMQGDILVQTVGATYSGSGAPVVRELLAADQASSSNYYQSNHASGGATAGVYGVALCNAASNASQFPQTPATLFPANIPYPYGESQLYPNDPTTGYGVVPVDSASGNIFAARFYGGTTRSFATLEALAGGQLGGITLLLGTGTNGLPLGQMYYFLDVQTTPGLQIAHFLGWNTNDPLYAATVGAGKGWTGSTSPLTPTPEMFFEFTPSFSQAANGVAYNVSGY